MTVFYSSPNNNKSLVVKITSKAFASLFHSNIGNIHSAIHKKPQVKDSKQRANTKLVPFWKIMPQNA